MRGARPKPTELKVLCGTFRKDRANGAEPQLPVEVPMCPRWLNALGRAAWREYAPLLAGMRVLTAADRPSLAQLCSARATYRAAMAVIEAKGMTFTVRTENGTVVRARPEVAIAQDADRRIRAWSAEFGLTPAGRPRVHAREPEPNTDAASTKRRRFFGVPVPGGSA